MLSYWQTGKKTLYCRLFSRHAQHLGVSIVLISMKRPVLCKASLARPQGHRGDRMYIFVLGMPHSGAGRIARLLQMTGAKPLSGDLLDTGEEVMPACLERTEIGRLHRRIFQATDTDWDRIDGIDANKLPTASWSYVPLSHWTARGYEFVKLSGTLKCTR